MTVPSVAPQTPSHVAELQQVAQTPPPPAKIDADGDRDGTGSPHSAGLLNVKV